MNVITIERKVLEKNDEIAGRNRELFRRHRLFVFNLVSSPGAGKTSLLERTAEALKDSLRMAVVAGDVQTDLDAQRVARYGIPAVQIVTRGGCHLDAKLVEDALGQLDLAALDLLVLENVGNLVCPAEFDIGEDARVVVLSVAEGEDKPVKYPLMFRVCDAALLNKIDLLPYLDYDIEAARGYIRQIKSEMPIFDVSAKTGEGFDPWIAWVKDKVAVKTAIGGKG